MTNGHTLILEPSRLYAGGIVLKHPLTLETVVTKPTRKKAIEFCKREHYSWMDPVQDVPAERLEMKI